MKHIKHWLATMAVLLCSVTANAHDFEVGGIYYNITSSTDLTVEVTYKGSSYNSYRGDIIIPSAVLYNGNTYTVTSIGDYAFCDCSSLTSITISENVVSVGYRAFYCSNLTFITFLEISKLASIGSNAFYFCSSLTSITIPASVTNIDEYAFSQCKSLTSITFLENSKLTSIGNYAFENCGSLTSITFLETSKLTSIGNYAFEDCSSLTSITIPASVTSIGQEAFSWCYGLTSITCEAVNPPTTGKDPFYFVSTNIPLYVPQKSISAYQAANYWKNFSIRAIPIPENITLPIGQYGSGTYCSEYALDFSEVEGLKAYVAAGYDSETGVVTLLRVMTANAGVGLFVKGEPGDYVVPTLESTSYNALNMLVGTLEETTVNSTDGSYTNYKYTIREGDAEPKFYPFADASTQAAGRAYLQIPTAWLSAAEQKSISIRFDEGEGTTDIEDTEFTIQNSALIYDLMGRRVANPTKGGIYIVNGKKTVF